MKPEAAALIVEIRAWRAEQRARLAVLSGAAWESDDFTAYDRAVDAFAEGCTTRLEALLDALDGA